MFRGVLLNDLFCVDEDERAYYLKTVASRKQLAKSQREKKKRNIRGQDKVSGGSFVLWLTAYHCSV